MSDRTWWQRGVVYQVYPRSFQDSDGDGVGDLRGLLQRLDYLQWLGVDAVWLSPIFPSPMADFGYDVADYTSVDSLFGDLADLDELVAALHGRGMKLLLDLVPNHTSDRHPWFLESRASRDSPRRDWYVWRDAEPDGGPPNAIRSVFGGPAWEWDEGTRQFYFHAFLKEQPDLDWNNPDVRAAIADVLRFWFGLGIDGFRIDVIWMLGKRAALERGASTGTIGDEPGTFEAIAGLRAVADEFPDRVLVGEIYLPPERLVRYYGTDGGGLHLPFNFQLLELPWDAAVLASAIERYEALLPEGAWPNWVLGNHDRPRIATRVGEAQARVAAMLLLTLRGTPTIYYGDEIGMQDAQIRPELERDPAGLREPGKSRDPERTPMRWVGSPTGGFTSGAPWLPMGEDVARVNVEAESTDPNSMLSMYRRLLRLRREEPALSLGGYRSLGASGNVMAYERRDATSAFLVLLNLGERHGAAPELATEMRGTIVLATHVQREGRPFVPNDPLASGEGFIVRLA